MSCCGTSQKKIKIYSDIHAEHTVKINDAIMKSLTLDFHPDKFIELQTADKCQDDPNTIDNSDAINDQLEKQQNNDQDNSTFEESKTISEQVIYLNQQEESKETSFESESSEIPEEQQNNKLKRNPDLLIQQESEQAKVNNQMINNLKKTKQYQKLSTQSKNTANIIIEYLEGDINNLELSDDKCVTDIKRKIQTDYDDFIKQHAQNTQIFSESINGVLGASILQKQNYTSLSSPIMTQNIESIDQLQEPEKLDKEALSFSVSSSQDNQEMNKTDLQLNDIQAKVTQNQRLSYVQNMSESPQSDSQKVKIYKQYILLIIKQIRAMNIYDAQNIIQFEKIEKQRIERDVKIKDFNLYKNVLCEKFYITSKHMQNLSQLKQLQIIYNFLIQNKDQLMKKETIEKQIQIINDENSKYNPNKVSPNLKRKQMLIAEKISLTKDLQSKFYELIIIYSEQIDDSRLYETIVSEYIQQASKKQSSYIL